MNLQPSIIVPALDKAGLIAATLDALAPSNAHHNPQRAPR